MENQATEIQVQSQTVFDVTQYELNEVSTLTVRNARDDADLLGTDGKPVCIELFGPGSDEYWFATHKMNNASTARMHAAMRGKAISNQAEMSDSDQIRRLVACTARISANFPVSAHEIYSNRKLSYIRTQVEQYIDGTANFSKLSAAN